MERIRQILCTGMIAFGGSFLAGCGQRTAPSPELLGPQLVLEAVDAVAAEDEDLATSKIARLESVYPAAASADTLLRLVVDNSAVSASEERATASDALRQLDEVRSRSGSSARLDDAAYELMDLELVGQFASREWERSRPMGLAFKDLPEAKRWPNTSYERWHQATARRLAAMQEAERRRLVDNLVRTIDRSEVAGEAEGASAALTQLARLAPAHALVDPTGTEGAAVAAEIGAWRGLRADAGGKWALPGEPLTLCGRGAVALRAARAGDRVTALASWRSLKEAFPSADDRLIAPLLADGKTTTRLAAVPTAGSILGLLADLATTNSKDK